MPVNKHLNWVELSDFTKGLYDEQASTKQLLGPSGALVVCTDYEPRVGGGLRAFFKGATLATTGLTSPTTARCAGIWSAASLADRSGKTANLGYDRFLSYIGTDDKARLARMDGTNEETTWKSAYADAAGAGTQSAEATDFEQFETTAGVRYLVWVQRNGSAVGVYTIQLDYTGAALANGDGTTTKLQSYQGPITVSQARLIMCNGRNALYTDVGKVTFTSTTLQSLQVDPNDPAGVICMAVGVAPSDLLFGLRGAPWFAVQGDISSVATPVREMANDHHQRAHYQKPSTSPGGVATFIEPGGRIFVTDGRSFRSISDQIGKFDIDIGSCLGPGQLTFADHYLFAPNGHVYDFDTGAWFKSSLLPTSAWHFFDGVGKIYMANAADGISLAIQRIFEGGDATVTRMDNGVIQTIPFRDAAGLDVRISEVQINMHCYGTSDVKVDILDADASTVLDTQTITGIVTGTSMTSFLFQGLPARYCSVKITPSAQSSSVEAPTIEAVRVGFAPNNNLVGSP